VIERRFILDSNVVNPSGIFFMEHWAEGHCQGARSVLSSCRRRVVSLVEIIRTFCDDRVCGDVHCGGCELCVCFVNLLLVLGFVCACFLMLLYGRSVVMEVGVVVCGGACGPVFQFGVRRVAQAAKVVVECEEVEGELRLSGGEEDDRGWSFGHGASGGDARHARTVGKWEDNVVEAPGRAAYREAEEGEYCVQRQALLESGEEADRIRDARRRVVPAPHRERYARVCRHVEIA
jgi:hypothetical protein